MEFEDLIRNRYSCKKFSNKVLEAEKLQKILEAGNLAPTAKNQQPQHIYVMQSSEALKAVDALTPCRYNAPVVLAVAYQKDQVFVYPGNQKDSGSEDASIVATHMLLSAANEGVDSCWINFFDPAKGKELLSLPENEELVMLLDLGYHDENMKPLDNHYKRKELSETVSYR